MLAVIPVLSRNTVMSLAHHGTVPHRRLDCFYRNKNIFLQLEESTIKTERSCSMQRTERTSLASQQSRSVLPTRFLALRDSFPKYNMITVGNSGAIWTGAGGQTISHSRRPFRTAYLHFILIEHRYSLHSDRYARAARVNKCFVLFYLSFYPLTQDQAWVDRKSWWSA